MVDNHPSAFGFAVSANRPLRFLRHDGARQTLDVETCPRQVVEPKVEPLVEWRFREAPGSSARLYRTEEHYAYWNDAGGTLIDPARGTICMPPISNSVLWEEHLWAVPALLCFLERQDFPLHAAAVEIDGGAVLLAAPGRHGKTTLALHLHIAGHRVLGEDLACCRLVGGAVELLPGPAMLRVRPDVFGSGPISGTKVAFRHPERVYLSIEPDRRGSGQPLPVRALVFLHVARDSVCAEPIIPSAALPDLWALSFKLPDAEARRRTFESITRLADCVPIWNVRRPLKRTSLPRTLELIEHIGHGLQPHTVRR